MELIVFAGLLVWSPLFRKVFGVAAAMYALWFVWLYLTIHR